MDAIAKISGPRRQPHPRAYRSLISKSWTVACNIYHRNPNYFSSSINFQRDMVRSGEGSLVRATRCPASHRCPPPRPPKEPCDAHVVNVIDRPASACVHCAYFSFGKFIEMSPSMFSSLPHTCHRIRIISSKSPEPTHSL